MNMTTKASVYPMLDSIRNSFFGRLQHPHSHFMEVGCHAITLATHGSDGKANERTGRLQDFMSVIEKMVRISD
jgi:hypothetical protein